MTFKNALQNSDFVVTAHVNMVDTPNAKTLIQHGEVLRPAVDAIQLIDNSVTDIQMAGLAAAALLIPHGIDPIVHMTCQDRNRIAMGKDLIGAAALGVSSVLVSRGKKIPDSNKAGPSDVLDIKPLDFMKYIQSLKQNDDDLLASDFLIGAYAELRDPGPDWASKNLIRKIDAGANFIQYQPCFDMDVVRKYMASMVAAKLTHRVKFMMSLSLLRSAKAARWMRNNVTGAFVPESVIERLELSSDPHREGIEICAEFMRELATIPGVSGVNLSTLGRVESIPDAIEASGVRKNQSA